MAGECAETEVVVRCGGADHVIRWTGTDLELRGHPGGREDDDVLVALSGAPARCRTIEEAWHRLDRPRAEELMSASAARLHQIGLRVGPAVEQRESVRRRDDLTEGQRVQMLALFDQMIYEGEIARLGPDLARCCAERVVRPRRRPWRRRETARPA